MNSWIKGKSLIIMDCEGAELGLLKPNKCKNLCKVDILVEVHEFIEQSMSERLTKRFSQTHKIHYVPQSDRELGNFEILKDRPFYCNHIVFMNIQINN